MKITINGEAVDYTLENETSAGEVIEGITTWLDKSGMLVGGVIIDEETVPLSGAQWHKRPISEIDSIAVEALSLRESRVRQLETARDYFILLYQASENNDIESLNELSEGFPDLQRMLPHLFDEGPYPTMLPRLETVLSESGFPLGSETDGKQDMPNLPRIASEAKLVAAFLESRRKEASSPEDEARSAAAALAMISDNLGDVAVNLQTGKDRQAMDTIIRLTELLQSLLRSLYWIQGSRPVEDLVSKLNGILAELEDALKASDTVLIGDLLEYEIKPLLIGLPATLGFIEKEISE